MKAAELRQSILQAAVQGKLVPQNPQDEPASELLKRIQQEKAQLVKAGKLKKEKPLLPITEDEIPFDLPEGWEWCRFGTLVYNRDSERIPVSRVEREKRQKLYDYYGASGIIDRIDNFLFDETLLLIGEDGANLLARSTPIAFLASGKYWVNNHAHVLDSISEQFLEYLALYINAIDLSPYVTGTAQPKMNQERMNSILVAIPSESEQKRIIKKVNKLMLLCDRLEAEEKKLDALEAHFAEYLPKAILQAAVQGKLVPQNSHDEPASELLKYIQLEKARLVKEDKLKKDKSLPPISEDEIPYDLPEGWEWTRISDITIINPRNSLPDDTEVSFLPMNHISQDYFGGHQQQTRMWSQVKSGFTHFAENDVLIAKITPCFQNGKSCIAHDLKSGYGAGTTELHVLRPFGILSQYLLIFLKSPDFLETCTRNMTGTAGQQRVPTNYIQKYIFPLPPLSEQRRIVAKVSELMALCDKLKAAYTTPVILSSHDNIIPFPVAKREEETLLAARGDVGQLSNEAMQAIDDLFAEDEE